MRLWLWLKEPFTQTNQAIFNHMKVAPCTAGSKAGFGISCNCRCWPCSCSWASCGLNMPAVVAGAWTGVWLCCAGGLIPAAEIAASLEGWIWPDLCRQFSTPCTCSIGALASSWTDLSSESMCKGTGAELVAALSVWWYWGLLLCMGCEDCMYWGLPGSVASCSWLGRVSSFPKLSAIPRPGQNPLLGELRDQNLIESKEIFSLEVGSPGLGLKVLEVFAYNKFRYKSTSVNTHNTACLAPDNGISYLHGFWAAIDINVTWRRVINSEYANDVLDLSIGDWKGVSPFESFMAAVALGNLHLSILPSSKADTNSSRALQILLSIGAAGPLPCLFLKSWFASCITNAIMQQRAMQKFEFVKISWSPHRLLCQSCKPPANFN